MSTYFKSFNDLTSAQSSTLSSEGDLSTSNYSCSTHLETTKPEAPILGSDVESLQIRVNLDAIESVKKRWNSLRDVFRREFHKVNKSEDGEPAVPTWSHYQSMSFLCSQMKTKSNHTILEITDPELLICNYDEDAKYDSSNLISLKNVKRKQSKELDLYEDLDSKKRQSVTFSENDDSDYHFLMSLLPFLKAVPYHRKLSVRMRLQQILTEEYSHNRSQTFCNVNSPLENIAIMPSPKHLDDER